MAERIIPRRVFAARLGTSEATLVRREEDDPTFPPRRVLSAGRVGYLESEADAYMRALPVGRLVSRTKAARSPEAQARAREHRAATVAAKAAARDDEGEPAPAA